MNSKRYTKYVRRVGFTLCLGGVMAVSLAMSRDARADRSSVHLELDNGLSALWVPRMPTMSTNEIVVGPRTLSSQDVKPGGSITGLGYNFDIGIVIGDRWNMPLFGASIYGAVGNYDRIRTSIDGSIATVRPWTTWDFDVLLPGFGYRVKHRRWLFSATARLGASLLMQNGSVVAGTESTDVSFTAATFEVFGELEACRRLDPLSRVCLLVAPRLVGFGFMNGGTLAIRMELGK